MQNTGELWVALTWSFCDLVVKFVSWEIDIVYAVESQGIGRSLGIRDKRAGYGPNLSCSLWVTLDKLTPKRLPFHESA